MKLREILKDIHVLSDPCDPETEISSVTIDSRKAGPGSLFVAVLGADSGVHGIRFAKNAVENGAAAVVADVDCEAGLPCIRVEDASIALAMLSANLWGRPAEQLKVIGVTGTNGKTTTTHLIRDILTFHGHKCGLIGTNELQLGDRVVESHESYTTTPEPPMLHRIFREMVDAGCEYAIMEVSSHALALDRVYGVRYTAAAYTNLSQDHLNYHKTMEAYAEAKSKLFRQADWSVINIDDSYSDLMRANAAGNVITFSRRDNSADLMAKNVKLFADSAEFQALSTGEIQRMRIGIPGGFSVENALTAVGVCRALGLDFASIAQGLATAKGVCGRAEVVPVDEPYTVMIDYAHSPDSLENILRTVRPITQGRVIVVFGCGGDRDRTKRPIMGHIAECMADVCVVTSDNPRTEVPSAIIDEIVSGMKKTNHVCVENRREAIGHALDIARPGDFVLIAGKGQEMYQEIMGVKHPFDERVVIREHLREQKGGVQ